MHIVPELDKLLAGNFPSVGLLLSSAAFVRTKQAKLNNLENKTLGNQ